MLLRNIIAFLLSFTTITSFAQYKQVDDHIKKIGSLDTLNMGTIASIITKNFPDKISKTRAIFDWIALNINYDVKAGRNNDNSKTSSDEILKSRKATAFGYSALFQDMCSVAGIRCLTVDGYIRTSTDEIPDELNHSWDVVQLGLTSSEWYYVDPTWGSGYMSKDGKTFTKAFDDSYFFTDRSVFNAQHFPDNTAWLLGMGIKNKKEFFAMPVIKVAANEFGVTAAKPVLVTIKTKVGKSVQFSIAANRTDAVTIVSLALGDIKKRKIKQVDFSTANGSINFTYKFDESDSYPISVLFNGKEVVDYFVDITE